MKQESIPKYSNELVDTYTKERENFSETDIILFSKIDAVGGLMGKRVLDLGCGAGSHIKTFKNMGAQEVIGIDINEGMIRKGRENVRGMDGVSFIVADGEKIPLKDSSIDFVISNYVIQYFLDVQTVFKEINRVLKSGGHFIGTINIIDVQEGHEHLHNTEIPIQLGKDDSPVIVRFYIKSHKEIHDAITSSGLTILNN